MSVLIISHDLHIMMLELAVENLHVPRTSVFDSAILKKTTVMFRLLDDEWTALYPHRSDYREYRGSNYEHEPFNGGKSVVFSLPEASLENSMKDVDLQIHISRDISRYFELHPSQNVGFVIVKLDKLFNGIINELKDRRKLAPYLHFHEREPISRSMKGAFSVLNENSKESGSHIDLYIRLSYFGKSITTEIVKPTTMAKSFYAREETNEKYPYQCRELKSEELESGCWGSVTLIPPTKLQNLQCDCQTQKQEESLRSKTDKQKKIEINDPYEKKIADKETQKTEEKEKEGKGKKVKNKDKKTSGKRAKKGVNEKMVGEEENKKTQVEEKKIEKEKKEMGKENKKTQVDDKKIEKEKKETIKENREMKKKETGRRKEDKEDKKLRKKDVGTETEKKLKNKEVVQKDKEKPKTELTEKMNPDKIKMLRRRGAGSVTVGLFETKTRSCLPLPPPCACFECNPPIYLPTCTFPSVSCLKEQNCKNNSELLCF